MMAQKRAHEVDRFIANPEPGFPLILIYGPDRGLVSERALHFAQKTGITLDDPFSTVRLDANDIDVDPARLGDEARTLSLFGAKRFIWLSGVGTQKGVIEAVKWLIAEPPQQAIVLIEAGDLRKGNGLRTAVEAAKCAIALPCYSDDGRATEGLITQVLGEFDIDITREARQILRENLGENRLASRAELEKLCLYAMGKGGEGKGGDKGKISVEDVMACISNVSVNSQDHILDALLLGDIAHFNERFDRHCETGQPLFLIISAAMRQFQQLSQLRDVMDRQGKSASAAVAAARPPIFYQRQKTIESALQHWTAVHLLRACARLQTCLLESRKFTALAAIIIHKHLLALTVEAARLSR